MGAVRWPGHAMPGCRGALLMTHALTSPTYFSLGGLFDLLNDSDPFAGLACKPAGASAHELILCVCFSIPGCVHVLDGCETDGARSRQTMCARCKGCYFQGRDRAAAVPL